MSFSRKGFIRRFIRSDETHKNKKDLRELPYCRIRFNSQNKLLGLLIVVDKVNACFLQSYAENKFNKTHSKNVKFV